MKKWIVCLLLSLLLTGCGRKTVAVIQPEPETSQEVQVLETLPPTTVPTTEETLPETEATLPEPEDEDFVRILDYIPTATQELFYATDRNFTGQVIYDFSDAYLRYGTAKKLMAVSEDLAEMGLRIKIWDGFRPVAAQFTLWEICPNPTYVANPNVGFSSHSRGNTVDLTLTDEAGQEITMPTGFDDFTIKADRDYSDCTQEEAANAQILELLMEKHGFKGYQGEWWHFSDTDGYDVEEVFLSEG